MYQKTEFWARKSARINTHTHTHTSARALLHGRIHTSVPANIHTHAHAHAHAPKRTNTHTQTPQTCARTHKRARTHTQATHTKQMRAPTHTQKSILVPFHETQCRNPLKPKIKCICLTNKLSIFTKTYLNTQNSNSFKTLKGQKSCDQAPWTKPETEGSFA